MHFSKCLAGISGGVGIFIIYQRNASGKSGEGGWRCSLLWPPGVTLPFNDCTTIVRPHPEGPGSWSNFLCPQNSEKPRRCLYVPERMRVVAFPLSRPSALSAATPFCRPPLWPEPAFSKAVSAPLTTKCGRGPVSLLPSACNRLRHSTELCWRLTG